MVDEVSASKKLQATDASGLLRDATVLIVMKGKKVEQFDVAKAAAKDAVSAMLGPTGNLRAPTIRTGKTLLVGFNEDVFARELG